MEAAESRIYCIDTSSLVNLHLWRPKRRFVEVWGCIDQLIDDDRLVAPIQVFRELARKDDALAQWAKSRKSMFKRTSPKLVKRVQEVLRKFPDLIDQDEPAESADPYLVALAIHKQRIERERLFRRDVVVITEEKYALGRTRIPRVCEQYGLKYLTIHQMFLFEDWNF